VATVDEDDKYRNRQLGSRDASDSLTMDLRVPAVPEVPIVPPMSQAIGIDMNIDCRLAPPIGL
jgi:hypothetical protein